LRVTEQVIKFITVRMDEEEKRLNKIKAIRASRTKLSDQAPSAESVEAPVAQEESAQASA
jgi:small subunit ribosomal protein S6